MDMWVVAAAAGAGYLGKHLQNLPSSEKQKLVESSSKFSNHTSIESRSLLQQIRDKTCPLRRLAQERALKGASDEKRDGFHRRILDMEQLESTSTDSQMASASCKSDDVKEDRYVLWLSSLPPRFSKRENILHSMELVDTYCSPFELRKFKLLRSRVSGYYFKPLSSLQSDLAPQLYKEHEKVEEYIYSSDPSPFISTMKPLLITEGTEIISRSNSIPMGIWPNGSQDTSDPSLDNINSLELHGWTNCSTKRVSDKASHSPGSPKLMLLLMVGLTIGIISTTIANENEVTNLNEQIKQANSLVQDLQEELEMKDKLTVKDLADEESQSISIKNLYLYNQELIPSVPEPQSDKPEASEIDSYSIKMGNARTSEDSLLRSEIEAELEAELARLELNIKTSVMEYGDDSDNDEESGTGTGQTLPPNYAVSPRELTIRLHELMESRLEARIKELETALQNNQNRLQFLESECIISRDISSTPESLDSVYR